MRDGYGPPAPGTRNRIKRAQHAGHRDREHLPRPRPEHQARPFTLPEPRTVRGTSPPRTPAFCGR
ncbi:hypothetical protein SFR_1871 [Streptomyces sp. FR-008]|nr:hypothetical protein SFR_1871 [Streptomyces sp. FR-008]